MLEVAEIRRKNLQKIADNFGSQKDFAEFLGVSTGYVNQLLTGHRNIGEKKAREIESKLNKPSGYLDNQNDSTVSTLASRLKQKRKESGLTQEQLAKRIGATKSAISQYESGYTQIMDGDKLIALAKTLNVTPDWLLKGKEQKPIESNAEWQPGFEFWDDDTPLSYDDIALPFFREVELSAGAGSCQVQENHGRKLLFSKRTLKSLGVSPEHAACVTVSGNSMEPILPDGATIGIDTSQTMIKDGKVYAIEHDGHLRVKRLYRMPGGKIRLNSYNKEEWPDETVTPDEIRILGKVFWSSVLWE